MTMSPRRLPGQPYVAIGTGAAAGCVLVTSWWTWVMRGSSGVDAATGALGLCLCIALVLTYRFPVHLGPSAKIYMGTIVLYLMAVLLPPPIAASAVGAGILAGELSVCQKTGNHHIPTIIPTQVSRWILVGLAGSLVAHVISSNPVIPLVGAGVVMWCGDILTGPLLISPMLELSPLYVIPMMIREGGVGEAAQYVIGLLGALEAEARPWTLLLLVLPAALVYVAFRRAKELGAQTRVILEDMADAVDQRDIYTADHCRRVARLASDMLRELGTSSGELDMIVFAARVHDIGKIRIPEELLQKPEKLSSTERAIVETHAEKGSGLLTRYASVARSADMVRHHHEAWDGNGYPDGLEGTDIPFGSRVIAVAESFDDMTSDRPYRRRMSPAQAASILRNGRGRQWDPELVDVLIGVVRDEIEEPVQARPYLVRGLESEGNVS